jgi:hypothetical protein
LQICSEDFTTSVLQTKRLTATAAEVGLTEDARLAHGAAWAVMRDAGLTHGGLYKHFESKNELLMEALGEGFRESTDRRKRFSPAQLLVFFDDLEN